jgi:hypothetical protein
MVGEADGGRGTGWGVHGPHLLAFALAVTCALLGPRARAHEPDLSQSEFKIDENGRVAMRFSAFRHGSIFGVDLDDDHDRIVTEAELDHHRAEVLALVGRAIRVGTGDRDCALVGPTVALEETDGLVVTAAYDCGELGETVRAVHGFLATTRGSVRHLATLQYGATVTSRMLTPTLATITLPTPVTAATGRAGGPAGIASLGPRSAIVAASLVALLVFGVIEVVRRRRRA